MAELDRAQLIALLERLGGEDDASVLAAARELDRTVRDAGARWDDLLGTAEPDTADAPDMADDARDNTADELPEALDVSKEGSESDAIVGAEATEAAKLVERLLARKGLSDTLREDLSAMRQSLADKSFERMDLRYLRALAKRLGE